MGAYKGVEVDGRRGEVERERQRQRQLLSALLPMAPNSIFPETVKRRRVRGTPERASTRNDRVDGRHFRVEWLPDQRLLEFGNLNTYVEYGLWIVVGHMAFYLLERELN